MELAVAIVLIGVISLVAIRLFIFSVDGFNIVSSRQNTLQKARFAIAMLDRDLRGISSRNGLKAAVNEIAFTDMESQSVHYLYKDGRLLRNDHPLAEGIKDFTFRFERDDGNAIVSPADSIAYIWNIGVTIIAADKSRSVRLDSKIHPRNF